MRAVPILLLLVGCTTTAELREHTPVATYQSAKSVPALTECLAMEVNRGLPAIVTGETETNIAWGTAVATGLLITLRKSPSGSDVIVRELQIYTAKNAVERCV